MFIDASAIVAILAREPGSAEIEKRLSDAAGRFFVSPLVRFEASLGLARQKAPAGRKPSKALLKQAEAAVSRLMENIGAEEVAISPEIGRLALIACGTYGKAVGHTADLNFGDCFAYACAKALSVPLLYKGYDFSETDLA